MHELAGKALIRGAGGGRQPERPRREPAGRPFRPGPQDLQGKAPRHQPRYVRYQTFPRTVVSRRSFLGASQVAGPSPEAGRQHALEARPPSSGASMDVLSTPRLLPPPLRGPMLAAGKASMPARRSVLPDARGVALSIPAWRAGISAGARQEEPCRGNHCKDKQRDEDSTHDTIRCRRGILPTGRTAARSFEGRLRRRQRLSTRSCCLPDAGAQPMRPSRSGNTVVPQYFGRASGSASDS